MSGSPRHPGPHAGYASLSDLQWPQGISDVAERVSADGGPGLGAGRPQDPQPIRLTMLVAAPQGTPQNACEFRVNAVSGGAV